MDQSQLEGLKEKFKEEILETDWSALADHHKRGALFFIAPHLDLVTVAVAIATDETSLVKIWLDNDELSRATDERVEELEAKKFDKFAKFLIVQPYVIAQVLPST